MNIIGSSASKATPAWHLHIAATGLCLLVTAVCWPLTRWLDPVNIVMLFLLAVLVSAVFLGRRPAVLAAFLSVALFDFFFVAPQFSFAVNDVQYLVTFAVMLVVALTIGHLTTALKQRFDDAQQRAVEQSALYGLAQTLAGALTVEQSIGAVGDFFSSQFDCRFAILLPDAADELQALDASSLNLSNTEHAAASAAYRSDVVVDSDQIGNDDGERLVIPLMGATRKRGVLIVAASEQGLRDVSSHRALVQAVATLLTTALERLHYVDVASRSELEAQGERLRSSILAALSHDIRTPLTAMHGMADSLAIDLAEDSRGVHETAIALRDQSMLLNGMVTNLLDMARMQSGHISLRREWQPLDEVIGASIRFSASALKLRKVKVRIAENFPLVNIDAVLMERVLCNLFENAAKYSPESSEVALDASVAGAEIHVMVCNAGNGFPRDRLEHVFKLFERGKHERALPGMGVGLAVCRAIVEAHGGHIRATNLETGSGGACVTFTLPRGAPPSVDVGSDGASA